MYLVACLAFTSFYCCVFIHTGIRTKTTHSQPFKYAKCQLASCIGTR